MKNLDRTDRAILYLLQTDARELTNTEISDRVDVSPTTVGERISRLKATGVLKTCHTEIDYEKAGIPYYLHLSCSTSTSDRSELASTAIQQSGVVTVKELLSGDQNLHVEIVGTSNEGVAETIRDLETAGIEIHDVELIKEAHRRPFDGFGNPDAKR